MKKFRFAALAALLFAVFALTGCELWKAAKEVTKNKWTSTTVKSKAVGAADESKQYDLKVYLYYTDAAKTEGNLSLGAGLNVVIEADAGNAKFFGEDISTASYAVKTFAPGEKISNGKDGDSKKEFVVSDDKWAAAYALGVVKSSSDPASKSGDYESLSEKLSSDYWKEFMAEKIVELLLND